MKLTILYRKIPVERRLCHICGKPILRNIDLLNGEICHHGCINKTGLGPTHRCLDCLNLLTPDNVLIVNYPDSPKQQRACGLCGSFNITPLRSKRPRGEFVELPHLSGKFASPFSSAAEKVPSGCCRIVKAAKTWGSPTCLVQSARTQHSKPK